MPSSVKVPSSIRRASRSRAVSLSCPCWRSIFSGPPPSLACSRRSCRSTTSSRSGGRATSWFGAAVLAGPPPRLCSSLGAGRSVVDMRLLGHRRQERLDHVRGDGRGLVALGFVLGSLEGGHLEAHQLALLGHRLEQVVEL